MKTKNSSKGVKKIEKYSLPMRILHWIVGPLIIALLIVGLYMTNLPHEDTSRHTLYGLHKSFGVLVLIFAFVRLTTRLVSKIPAYPAGYKKWEITLAHIVHWTLYATMFIMPISGWLMSNYFGYPANFFDYNLPFLVEKNPEIGKVFAEIHEITAYTLIGLLCLHLAGVVKHLIFERASGNVIRRIW